MTDIKTHPAMRFIPDVLFGIAGIILVLAMAPDEASAMAKVVLCAGVVGFVIICRLTYTLFHKARDVVGTALALITTATALAIVGTGFAMASPVCPGSEVAGRCTTPEAATLGVSMAGSFALVVVVVVLTRTSWALIKAGIAGPVSAFWRWDFGSNKSQVDPDALVAEHDKKLAEESKEETTKK